MKNLNIIFEIIKRHCGETGTSNAHCFAELEKTDVNNSVFFPLFSYLRMLQSLGLIKLHRFRKMFVLTEKGKAADKVPDSPSGLLIVSLHFLQRVIIVSFLFLFFWPMFLSIQKQYNAEKDTEHQPLQG